jgi:hypothetical protein
MIGGGEDCALSAAGGSANFAPTFEPSGRSKFAHSLAEGVEQ